MHHNVTHALDDLAKAKTALDIAMRGLTCRDLEEALNNAGYTGTNMRPLRSYFDTVAVRTGVYVYRCEWTNDDEFDGPAVEGSVFVWEENGKILADW